MSGELIPVLSYHVKRLHVRPLMEYVTVVHKPRRLGSFEEMYRIHVHYRSSTAHHQVSKNKEAQETESSSKYFGGRAFSTPHCKCS